MGLGKYKDEPVAVKNLEKVIAISGGLEHSLALLEGNTVKAWGNNESGQLGDGNTTNTDEPVAVKNLEKVIAISAGCYHSLALLVNKTVKAWGNNEEGQLGDGSGNGNPTDEPVAVKKLEKVIAISAGCKHSLALLENGTVMAWGSNTQGELGDGNTTNTDEPVAVKKLEKVIAISAGGDFSLALLENGTVMAWGDNSYGQLGNGEEGEGKHKVEPVAVKNLTEVAAISAGGGYALAKLKRGTVKAWGLNSSGQLGDGKTANADEPVAVKNLEKVAEISAGGEHSLATREPGCAPECQRVLTALAWGSNQYGQLGDGEGGSGKKKEEPVAVKNLTDVGAISAGGFHSLAIGTP